MKTYPFDLTLVLEAPFFTAGSQASGLGVSSPLLRNCQGVLIIPGAQIRGIVRELIEKVGYALDTKSLFGQESGNVFADSQGGDNPFTPARRRLHFEDLLCQTSEGRKGGTTTRVAVSPETGSVKTGALQVIEAPFPFGQKVTFKGRVVLFGTAEEAECFEKAVRAILDFLPAIGGAKSAGFGFLDEANFCKADTHSEKTAAVVPADVEEIVLELDFQTPFLVNSQRIGRNVFQGSQVISGGAVKGALAEFLERSGTLNEISDDLSKMLFTQALPVTPEQKTMPRAVPLTFFSDGKGVYDAFMEEEVWWDLLSDEKHLTFAPDWKDKISATARQRLGWPDQSLSYDVRTRTKIAKDSHISDEGQLFSLRAVAPSGLRWRFVIKRLAASRAGFQKVVESLLENGLWSLGKTAARAQCRKAVAPSTAPIVCANDGVWRVTLQSPANLLTHEAVSRQNLTQAYLVYWQGLAKKLGLDEVCIEEQSFKVMSEERLEGGYQARRFQAESVLPYIVTGPGTVFEFKATGEGAQRFFEIIVREGLLPDGSESLDDWKRWRETPYARQNGFGQCTVDGLDFEHTDARRA